MYKLRLDAVKKENQYLFEQIVILLRWYNYLQIASWPQSTPRTSLKALPIALRE